MTMTSRGRLAALLCSAALVGVSACSKSSENSNKGAAASTAPKAAPSQPAPATPPKIPADGTTPAGAAQATAAGSRAETAEYVVEVVAPADVTAGAEAGFKVIVKPKGHWHFNLDFPTSVKVEAGEGVTVAKPMQKLADATAKSEEGGAEWALAITKSAAGEGTFKCDVKFAVCTDTTCDPKKETIAVKVEAK